MTVRLSVSRGGEIASVVAPLARLRIGVFRDWPYLYDGDAAYEARYLQSYCDSPDAMVVLAWDGNALVGAATGLPATDHAEVAEAYGALTRPSMRIFYCAESVLLPAYRGRGLGHRFFDAREAHARALGATHSGFCALQRPKDHPSRPAAARDLGPFWRKRGYAPVPGAAARMHWRDVGHAAETEKTLSIWMRAL